LLLAVALNFEVLSLEEKGVKKIEEKVEREDANAEGHELIGKRAPEFKNLTWLKGAEPLSMQALRGKVVLIRFWLGDCELCAGSAGALNYLYDKYGKDGFVVIGIHHPKSLEAKKEEFVDRNVDKLGFQFPIAIDNSWSTIDEYWLGKRRRSFTSASFLVDRHGLIRWIHPGGVLALDKSSSSPFAKLDSLIVKALGEK
jgi:peroxiredoxin